MPSTPPYRKLAWIVLAALMLGVAAGVLFGVLRRGKAAVRLETYFPRSVQGLDVGAPVKYRGVQIGRVKRIAFTGNRYEADVPVNERKNYVYVEMVLLPGAVGEDLQEAERFVQGMVSQGLRTRLKSAGLGVAGTIVSPTRSVARVGERKYIEVGHADPARYPPVPISWQPEHYYLPSVSEAQDVDLDESLHEIARRLGQVAFKGTTENLDRLVVLLHSQIEQTDLPAVSRKVDIAISDIGGAGRKTQALLDSPDVKGTLSNLARMSDQVRSLVDASDPKVQKLLDLLLDVSAHADYLLTRKEVEAVIADLPEITKGLRRASEELPAAVIQMRRAARRLNDLIAAQQETTAQILANLRTITGNLEELTDYAKNYPAHVLFGEPPRRLEIQK